MSQENVEIVRRSTDAFNRGDRDAALADYAPKAEWHTTGRFTDEGVYHGREGLERLWAETHEDMEMSLSISDIYAVGEDKVFVATAAASMGRRSKARYEQPMWFVHTLRDGLIVRVETYTDSAQALEAAGLRE
jgi:ketosteroid isomerase-like protein